MVGEQQPQLGGPIRQREAKSLQVRVAGSDLGFDGRDLPAAALDSCSRLPFPGQFLGGPAIIVATQPVPTAEQSRGPHSWARHLYHRKTQRAISIFNHAFCLQAQESAAQFKHSNGRRCVRNVLRSFALQAFVFRLHPVVNVDAIPSGQCRRSI